LSCFWPLWYRRPCGWLEKVGPWHHGRFCPVIGWQTILHLLARRSPESNAFSVPDRNTLWSRRRMSSLYKL
jgi:hypothetical protein